MNAMGLIPSKFIPLGDDPTQASDRGDRVSPGAPRALPGEAALLGEVEVLPKVEGLEVGAVLALDRVCDGMAGHGVSQGQPVPRVQQHHVPALLCAGGGRGAKKNKTRTAKKIAKVEAK